MALDTVIRSAVKIANTVTTSIQADITHYVYTGQSATGQPVYNDPVTLNAMVEYGQRPRQTVTGNLIMTKCKLIFLTPVVISSKDKLVLPNGETGPIRDQAGLLDVSTNKPYLTEVWLGMS